jgi:hypothetical protein
MVMTMTMMMHNVSFIFSILYLQYGEKTAALFRIRIITYKAKDPLRDYLSLKW